MTNNSIKRTKNKPAFPKIFGIKISTKNHFAKTFFLIPKLGNSAIYNRPSTLKSLFAKKITIAKWQFNLFGVICIALGFAFGAYTTLNTIIPKIFASDLTQEWDFSVSGDYTLSDSSMITVAGSSAKLAVQNYTSDANTAALFHFDESSGNPADSSSNANAATASNATYVTGNLNNAIEFNGALSNVSMSDSTSLSLSQSHTLEAWVKLDNAYSANSNQQRQGIIDKGEYQLYYDRVQGKLTYELAPSNADSWTQVAGGLATGTEMNGSASWDLNGKLIVESSVEISGNLYVGLGNGQSDAEVWMWNGTIWSMVGGDGINSSWTNATYDEVYSMETDGTNLFVGLGLTAGEGEVWQYNGSIWTKIGGDGSGSAGQSWATNVYEYVTSLAISGTTLYVGLGSSANDAEVWHCTIGSCTVTSGWTKIGGDSLNSGWTTNFEAVRSMTVVGTTLHVGLGDTVGDAEVWRWGGATWTRIGGDGINTSWADATYEIVTTLANDGTYLFAGIGNSAAGEGEVWRCDTTSSCTAWTKIGGDATNSSWADSAYEQVWDLTVSGATLYAGIGNTAGDNEVWSCTAATCTTWAKIGGDGTGEGTALGFTNTHTNVRTITAFSGNVYVGLQGTGTSGELWRFNGSIWNRIGGNYINSSWGYTNLQSVETMTTSGAYLYAGTGLSTAGNALVWRYDGTSWTMIGGQGLNSSWAVNTYELVNHMIDYRGDLYVALGISANEAEVWKWNGTIWSQIGGDSLKNGWTTNYDNVRSLAVAGDRLIAGLGDTAGEAEVWAYDGTADTWAKIGGDGTGTGGQSWAAGFEQVISMAVYGNSLYVGLGITAGDAEVWTCTIGSCAVASGWTKMGGDGLNSSWNTVYERIEQLLPYNGGLYVGLGLTADDAEVWKYTTSSGIWAQVGGDGLNNSWTASTYERVRNLTVYNGDLYAGLGLTAGDGEVWKYNGSTWAKIGGDSLNNGWASANESVASMSVYKGKLYAGLGDTANADATIWAYGNNSVLKSTASSQDTNWHHIAATYDGTTMRLYIDGVLDNTLTTSLTLLDTTHPVLIGANFGGNESGIGQGFLAGQIDEVRISNIRRTEFNTTPYTASAQTVKPTSAYGTSGILSWDGFTADETVNGGTITYRLSNDNGSTWKYYNSGWVTSSSTSQTNSAAVINSNIATFPVSTGGFVWQGVLDGNGSQLVTLNSVTLTATADSTAPTPPDTLTALNQSGGSAITTNTWYKHTGPYFSWSGATDTGGSGVSGYYVYYGTDNTADPQTAGSFQAGTTYTASGMSSGTTYYLRIKSADNAGNTSSIYAAFIYKYDSTSPTNPSLVSVNPAGFATTNDFTFSWAAAGAEGGASDSHSGLSGGSFGYEYQTGAASANCSSVSGWTPTTSNSVNIPDAAYLEGSSANIFYLRTIDNAGNTASACVTVNYYFAGEGPSAPLLLTATPSTNTTNSFGFSWQVPTSYSGDASDLTYCYTVNTLPSENSCTFTSAGATSLSADSFATQQGLNTFYVSAKNPEDLGGVINYGVYASVTFTANTSAPGIPGNIDIADVSVKSTSSWKLAVSWEAPSDIGSGIENYEIFHSTDDVTYTEIATTSGIAYVDTGLTQAAHYYKVRACDSVSNCGAYTSAVDLTPTGKFTDAPSLSSGPVSTSITTKKATITWSTDRTSDSKVSYGTTSGSYFSEEPSNSTQVTAHTINITNLTPGTTYYYKAKWTDEDGNTGFSAEKTFTTEPAPTVTDPKVKSSSLTSAVLEFTVKGASKAKIYFGKTSAFGGVKEISTSTVETTYNTELEELEDGTKYFYKINTLDTESAEYEGSILSFETLPRPKIVNVRVQQVNGTAQSTLLVTWSTNTDTSSIVTYYPENAPSEAKDEINIALITGEHKMIIKNLLPQTNYTLLVKGRDKAGNEAISEPQKVTTATDTRAPQITDLNIEGSTTAGNNNQEATAQLVISWNTDEASTSQVEFGEGTGTTYSQKTQEDTSTTTNHLVVISGLSPSKVYHLRALSKDSAANVGNSIDTVTITPKATDNALNLVISNLSQIFGFLGGIAN